MKKIPGLFENPRSLHSSRLFLLTSADDQLRVWRKTSDIKAVVDGLIEMTVENVPREVVPVPNHSELEPLLVA